MTRIFSIHEYNLKNEIDPIKFEDEFIKARINGLFDLPGLARVHLVKGVKGSRTGQYAAIWEYENREAWENLWGDTKNPKKRDEYPKQWVIWEETILNEYLHEDPDQIRYTAYEEIDLDSEK